MTELDWRPAATLQAIKERADLQASIRAFFRRRGVLEVETPILARAGVTDLHVHNLSTRLSGPGMPEPTTLFLQTSPEYAMKRLLAAGSGPIFQLCKVFRDDEISRRHNPEFTMLEWYRPGYDDYQLMQELDELMQELLSTEPAEQITYQHAFLDIVGIDPFASNAQGKLLDYLSANGYDGVVTAADSLDTVLQLVMSVIIEPRIGQERPCYVTHFPASQAALAKLDPADTRMSRRFELFFRGLELANGFWELTDAALQAERFHADNQQRLANGLQPQPIDEQLLAALAAGMPECAGVAVGVDRLLMLKLGAASIAETLCFPIDRC
ncbi:MAG: elongation factor P--(R)-beta-lysine ligase [Aliidiomarina sp.]|uniref:elongation factor P--(R)-beta-lysine ligase n=1 Tax=Aliidiomarina sp. TaxID=1872439 RepID=UPI0025C5E06D|nr:elongation factor P--(R)-beta-lysine ligase [Aliidiomarina sp.]MCH8502529.1 elongation factor P--(R)-beta-lysine ligase [Aliidiomarina sp.]